MPLPEQTRLELEAIDAALAGEPVDPQFAEFAELALLLADAKPALPAPSAAELDRRFIAMSAGRADRPARQRWFLRPAWGAGLGVALTLAVLVVVLAHSGGGSRSSASAHQTLTPDSAAARGSSASSASSASAVPTPQSNGRRTVQTSQLSLTAASTRVGTVAQELFDVVGSERGIVKHSQVSTGPGAYASFTLSVPTANLSATLARLAQLRYATVASSSASSADVNSQYLDDQRRLADARALRSTLLNQLAAATTTTAIDTLKTQIRDAESAIATDESAVNGLQSRISDSAVSVSISAADPVAQPSAHSGFTLRRSAHDALDVLRVAAGVVLIGLAVLVPLALLAGAGAWLTHGWRRRRRERALDAG